MILPICWVSVSGRWAGVKRELGGPLKPSGNSPLYGHSLSSDRKALDRAVIHFAFISSNNTSAWKWLRYENSFIKPVGRHDELLDNSLNKKKNQSAERLSVCLEYTSRDTICWPVQEVGYSGWTDHLTPVWAPQHLADLPVNGSELLQEMTSYRKQGSLMAWMKTKQTAWWLDFHLSVWEHGLKIKFMIGKTHSHRFLYWSLN